MVFILKLLLLLDSLILSERPRDQTANAIRSALQGSKCYGKTPGQRTSTDLEPSTGPELDTQTKPSTHVVLIVRAEIPQYMPGNTRKGLRINVNVKNKRGLGQK